MDAFQQLAELFRTFPGIGPRQAERFVYHVITSPAEVRTRLIDLLKKVNEETSQCRSCMRYFPRGHHADICSLCSNPNRSAELLLVVARDRDITVIEKSGSYEGFYFVLGGTIPILEKNPDEVVRIPALIKHIKSHPDIQEVIIAMNQTSDGENTADHLIRVLRELSSDQRSIKVSTLGRGIATGQEIEYSDGATLRSALKGRSVQS